MITPDEKDWTWVLEQTCPECGFDASACSHTEVAEMIRANAAEWQALQDDGRIAAGRPDPARWSSLEYACHVRDVYARFDQRMALMLDEDDPLFPKQPRRSTFCLVIAQMPRSGGTSDHLGYRSIPARIGALAEFSRSAAGSIRRHRMRDGAVHPERRGPSGGRPTPSTR